MPSLSHLYAFLYAFPMPFLSSLCLLYPISMPMPIIALPSLSHLYAYAYHRFAFSIPSLCLSLCLSYAYAYLSLRRHLNHFRVLSTCEGLWGFFSWP